MPDVSNMPDPAVLDALYGAPGLPWGHPMSITLRALRARRDHIDMLIALIEAERVMAGHDDALTAQSSHYQEDDMEQIPDKITIGDKYDPAMKITDQAEADAYFELCVEHTMRMMPCDRAEAERIERSNLGYYAGYCSHDTRQRVEELFKCAHPILGAIAKVGAPTNDEAMQAGLDLAAGRYR